MNILWLCIALGSLISCPTFARAEDSGTEIDLSTFGEIEPKEPPSVWEGTHLEEVSLRDAATNRRPYISLMLGPSFAGLGVTEGVNSFNTHDTILAAGGAIGMAFERPNGQLRIETEGMGRNTYFGPVMSVPDGTIGLITASNWSVMENIWRDFMFTDRFGIYGGGGIGGGGYRVGVGARGPSGGGAIYVPQASSAFAWQAGGGLIYTVTDRLTFDVGYRYFSVSQFVVENAGLNFAASELMFTLRLYEPFRRWAR